MQIPLVIFCFERFKNIARIFENIDLNLFDKVYFFIDGHENGENKYKQEYLDSIAKVEIPIPREIIFRSKNYGIQYNIPLGVNEVLEQFTSVVVLEEDAIPGKRFAPFMVEMLNKFLYDERIYHISGYNLLPRESLYIETQYRRSIFIESYAWATWKRSWVDYVDDLSHIDIENALKNIQKYSNNKFLIRVMRSELNNAKDGLISTWAYRWLATIWRNDKFSLNSNLNYVEYVGQTEGTHTKTRSAWEELEVEDLSFPEPIDDRMHQEVYDNWMGENIYKGNFIGMIKAVLFRSILKMVINK